MPPLAPLLFCGAAVDGELSPEGGTRLTLDGWLQVDVSERAADLLLEAREQAGARWAAMLRSVRACEGYGGRFTGGPLLEALQPLLKLRAQPILPPPKVEARRGRGREGWPWPRGRGSGRGAQQKKTHVRQRMVRRRMR